jgi:hypothetical protein
MAGFLADACHGRESEIPMIAHAKRDQSKEAIYSNDNDIDVLYLFACQAEWRASCNEEAFWELLSSRHQVHCGRLPEGLLA